MKRNKPARSPSVQSGRLVCQWERIEVVGPRALALYFPAGNCCDMRGAIEIATFLLPEVKDVQTYAGGARDTQYVKRRGKWVALDWAAWQLRGENNGE